MATCKKCGARIRFIKTRRGKYMPVDPERVTVDDADTGTLLISDEGEVVRVGFEETEVQDGFVSHFATCPNADDFRGQAA
jgi:hypothetical protein